MLSSLLLTAGCTATPETESSTGQAPSRTDVIQTLAANGHVIVAGTQAGALFTTVDAGEHWNRHLLGRVSVIGSTSCSNGDFVVIDFYRTVWQGSADGQTWTKSSFDGAWTPLTVACDERNRWWVAGTGASIAWSDDNGANWHETSLGEDLHITALQFVNATTGIAVGEFGTVVTTQNGGQTWSKEPKISEDFYPYSLLFLDAHRGYISGVAGQTLSTQDGGRTWQPMANATSLPLYRLFEHDGVAFAVGAVGTVARADADGWHAVAYPDAKPLFLGAGASVNGETIVVGGSAGLARVVAVATPSRSSQLPALPWRVAQAGQSGAPR